jgi:hypothetical protein
MEHMPMLDSKVSQASVSEQLEHVRPNSDALSRMPNAAAWLAMLDALENEFRDVLTAKAQVTN